MILHEEDARLRARERVITTIIIIIIIIVIVVVEEVVVVVIVVAAVVVIMISGRPFTGFSLCSIYPSHKTRCV